jgi:hypothetical protein
MSKGEPPSCLAAGASDRLGRLAGNVEAEKVSDGAHPARYQPEGDDDQPERPEVAHCNDTGDEDGMEQLRQRARGKVYRHGLVQT